MGNSQISPVPARKLQHHDSHRRISGHQSHLTASSYSLLVPSQLPLTPITPAPNLTGDAPTRPTLAIRPSNSVCTLRLNPCANPAPSHILPLPGLVSSQPNNRYSHCESELQERKSLLTYLTLAASCVFVPKHAAPFLCDAT